MARRWSCGEVSGDLRERARAVIDRIWREGRGVGWPV